MRVLFIVNPTAGKGKANGIAPLIEEVCNKADVEYKLVYTTKPGEGLELGLYGAKEGFERIVAVGGDGTVNEVLNGIVGTSAALGVVPGGSGNDFIRSINESNDIEKLIYDNIYGNIIRADLGLCNGKNFINVASCGFDAMVVSETQKVKKMFSGSIAYVVALVKTIFLYKGKAIKLTIDNDVYEVKSLLTAIANGRYYGGGMLPAPKALINDGYFDICQIRQPSKLKMLLLFPGFMKGKHDKYREVSMYRGKKILLEASEKLLVNIDGEVFEGKKVEFEIIPGGINIIMPRSMCTSQNKVEDV